MAIDTRRMDPAVPRDPPRRRRRASLAAVAPGLAALLHYDRSAARYDLIAGFTVGLVAVPSALAMGELAGVPVQFGLYATLFPLAAYGLLATSRQHIIGPDAALSALTAGDARAARHRGRGGRSGALRGPGGGARHRHGRSPGARGRPAPRLHRRLLRQARAARLHQRRGRHRHLRPAREAARDHRRRQRLRTHGRGDRRRPRRPQRVDGPAQPRPAGDRPRRPPIRAGVPRVDRRARRGARRGHPVRRGGLGHRDRRRRRGRPAADRHPGRDALAAHRAAPPRLRVRPDRVRRHGRHRADLRPAAPLRGRRQSRAHRPRHGELLSGLTSAFPVSSSTPGRRSTTRPEHGHRPPPSSRPSSWGCSCSS